MATAFRRLIMFNRDFNMDDQGSTSIEHAMWSVESAVGMPGPSLISVEPLNPGQ
jgi:hypothetical protein